MTVYGVALGRKIFVDLWVMNGLRPLCCDLPGDLAEAWPALTAEDVCFVIVEESWFSQLTPLWRRKILAQVRPVWIPVPDMVSQGL